MSDIVTRDQEWHADVPRSIKRHAVFGLALMAFTFGGFGAWALLAPLAAAVISQGSFVATGQNKIVQHLEGGIIKEILVDEGDAVTEGETIIRLDESVAAGTKHELTLRRARLEAMRARLMAQNDNRGELVFPEWLQDARDDPEVASILDSQVLAFTVAQSRLAHDITIIERNLEAAEVRQRGYRIQLGSVRQQHTLLAEELEAKSNLLEAGLIRRPEVTAVRRALLEAEGQIGRMEAEIQELKEQRSRFETQIKRARDEYRHAALSELQSIQGELETVREQVNKADSVLDRAEVTAPVSGTIVKMHYHTTGGVIETGKPIAEILPAKAPLIVEVLIPRNEIDSVKLGQPATVRLVALNQRTTPVLEGEVSYVSADSMADTSSGQMREVYVARVSLPSRQVQRVPGFTPIPGMPAEIMIQTSKRTFAQYLAKPITDSMSRAFRER